MPAIGMFRFEASTRLVVVNPAETLMAVSARVCVPGRLNHRALAKKPAGRKQHMGDLMNLMAKGEAMEMEK